MSFLSSVSPNESFGDGSDGNVSISSQNTVNAYAFVTSDVSSSSTSISVDSTSGFSSEDKALLIQMQDGSSAGKNEFVTIQSTSSGTINLKGGTINSYDSGNQNSTSSETTQLVKIPQYENLTVNSSGTIVPSQWDGETGGIICIAVASTLSINGDIDASSSGFRGGNRGRGDFSDNCNTTDSRQFSGQGESFKGLGTDNENPNDGGGGGTTPGNECCATGGGGGGFRTNGGNGHGECGGSFDSGSSGEGGNTYGNSNLSDVFLGSGGGGGSGDSNDSLNNGNGKRGGNGGGIVFIIANEVVNNGSILCDGEDGPSGAASGSGGGSGGSIKIICDTFNNSQFVRAVGGNGANAESYDGSGGDGGDGRIKVNFVSSVSGNSNPPFTQEQVSDGPFE